MCVLERNEPDRSGSLIFLGRSCNSASLILALNRAEVAQLVEHSPEKAGVDSSILSLGTTPHFSF